MILHQQPFHLSKKLISQGFLVVGLDNINDYYDPNLKLDRLKKLGIEQENYGASLGPGHWSKTVDSGKIESENPTNGEIIASVYQCSVNDYTDIVNSSLEAYMEWRTVPAPERGQLIREMGNALRDYKDPLGSLVSLEMGKIKS